MRNAQKDVKGAYRAFVGDFNFNMKCDDQAWLTGPAVGDYAFTQWRTGDMTSGLMAVPDSRYKGLKPGGMIDFAIHQKALKVTPYDSLSTILAKPDPAPDLRTLFLSLDHFPIAYDVDYVNPYK